MPNSRQSPSSRASVLAAAVLLAITLYASGADAEPQAPGFAVERYYPSPAGGGWFVMDTLDMHGGLGGAVELAGGYASRPLELPAGAATAPLAVVSAQGFASFSGALTYDRYRLCVDLTVPVTVQGTSGVSGGYQFNGPALDLGKNPDTLSDARVGFDVRLYGDPEGPLRLGLGAQLLIPSGDTADDVSDGTYRGMVRALVAGSVGQLMYAAQLGAHLRPLAAARVAGIPQGSELLFGVAAGPRFAVGPVWSAVVGPEVFGETAMRSPFKTYSTGVEALLSARLQSEGRGRQLRLKLGAGGGLHPRFGAPRFRVLASVELFTQAL